MQVLYNAVGYPCMVMQFSLSFTGLYSHHFIYGILPFTYLALTFIIYSMELEDVIAGAAYGPYIGIYGFLLVIWGTFLLGAAIADLATDWTMRGTHRYT